MAGPLALTSRVQVEIIVGGGEWRPDEEEKGGEKV